MSLVPDTPGTTPSYWCTWGAQNYAVDERSRTAATGLEGHNIPASNLTETALFGPGGWAEAFPKVRGDLYIVYDVGWDVEQGVTFDDHRWRLGSLEVAVSKFPTCTGAPPERLRKLNELTQNAGWRGAGLWVAAHPYGDGRNNRRMPDSEVESYFRERIEWSHQAGIEYWKVDYGNRGADPDFRRMLTRLAAEHAPSLTIEHARSGGPLNDEECPWDTKVYSGNGEYRRWGNGDVLKESARVVEFSDVFRTYDVTSYLSIPTTLDRVVQLLAEFSGRTEVSGLLNCEDEVYIGAALGTAIGVMRHPQWADPEQSGYDPLELRNRADEVTRAVRWHRIAPAFGVGETPLILDERRLDDSWVFREGDSWAQWVVGREVVQGAPARVARNMRLPEVRGEEVPYVIAATHPNGAVSIATLPRIAPGRGFYHPLADVSIDVVSTDSRVGIFGRYQSLTLQYKEPIGPRRVLAQDLAGDRAVDITGLVTLGDRSIELSGHLVERVGLMAATPGDVSEPGLVLKLAAPHDSHPPALEATAIESLEWTGPRASYPPAESDEAGTVGPIVDYFAAAGFQIHGDTYPMTWADDGEIYTSSGDPNWGGKPHGLDIERFSGDPPDYTITRVNPMVDYRGNGGAGQKPSGMICIDGVLYLAFQNFLGKKPPAHGTRSQHGSDAAIVASHDHGLTWQPLIETLAAPMFPGERFGGPAFVNFGRNNQGARDSFAYAVSTDQWDNGSHLLLGRVPQDEILNVGSWEWVSGFDGSGHPTWTSELNRAVPVLSRHREISLPEMVYVAALNRYLMLTWSLNRDFDPNHGSQLFVYEAPEPWGPFALVHHEVSWESAEVTPYCPRLPLKWLRETSDGLAGWLQFSGSWRRNSLHYRSHVRPFRIKAR